VKTITVSFQAEWYEEFREFFRQISSFIEVYLAETSDDPVAFLKFLIKYSSDKEEAMELLMEELQISDLLINYLANLNQSKDTFICALRIVGNISYMPKGEYMDLYYKKGLLEALQEGLNFYHRDKQIQTETFWLFSNLIACNNLPITRSLLSSNMFSLMIRSVLVENLINVSAVKECMHVFTNLVCGYQPDIIDILIIGVDFFELIKPILDLEKRYNPKII
jgi:hypothetical protein